jgi:tetratricopeptide (TPR) repeat protein
MKNFQLTSLARWSNVLLTILTVACRQSSTATKSHRVVEATFVGERVCAECHAQQAELWRGSHHERAMHFADSATVVGNFNNATFTKDGVTTKFFKRQNQYFVRTDGVDGKLHEYKIAYTFGVYPLQQYLVEFTRGRYQVLSICWDARPAAEGGQRWFHLYPNEKIDYRDILHWTGAYQNWNFMCAECHSTNVQKNYRLAEDRFETSWSEINVACEACHGPGSRHVENVRSGEEAKSGIGWAFILKDTSAGAWSFAPGRSTAQRTRPLPSHGELEMCARCHSRRAQAWGEYAHGKPLAETHRLALLDEGVYEADGQIRDVEEVYEYGSFLQSKMYQEGVTCSDCHEPHSLEPRHAGNAICTQCHLPAKYDSSAHHFHKSNTAASQCIACHMHERRYMVIDGRRDHSFRVPRPDLSMKLGTSNACNDCHKNRSAKWAAEAVAKWYGLQRMRDAHFAEALEAAWKARPEAKALLLQAVNDTKLPAIFRATAVNLLPRYTAAGERDAIERAISDPDPLVRRAAAAALTALEPRVRLALGALLLNDPIRTVRLEVVPALASVPIQYFRGESRADFERVALEYRESQLCNADRADAHLNLGILDAHLGNSLAAESAYRTAIRLQPSFIPAYINLADLYRTQNREQETEQMLREALPVAPNHADIHHALGLSLIRQKRRSEGVDELATAARLRPEWPRYAYVLAVALHEMGERRRALQVLRTAHNNFPTDRDILIALIEYHRETGDVNAAINWAQKLVAISPNDANARQILDGLVRQP